MSTSKKRANRPPYRKKIAFSHVRAIRLIAMLSLSLNCFLFLCLWILEARVSKLESKHVDNTPLEINFGSK